MDDMNGQNDSQTEQLRFSILCRLWSVREGVVSVREAEEVAVGKTGADEDWNKTFSGAGKKKQSVLEM